MSDYVFDPETTGSPPCILAISDNPSLAAELTTIAVANGAVLQITPAPSSTLPKPSGILWIIDRQLLGKESWNQFCSSLDASSSPLIIIDRGVGRQNSTEFLTPQLPAGKVFFINQNVHCLVARTADALLKGEAIDLGQFIEELTAGR